MIDFKTLVHDHHAVLYRIALGILRDSSSAEDAVQEVYLDLLKRPGEAAEARQLRAFLARCVIHRALMQRRAAGRRDRREALSMKGGSMDPAKEAERRELVALVAALPEDQRLAVDLHYLQGFSLEEAAGALAVSDRTVSSRLKSGLERLRSALSGAGFAVLAASLETELSACEPAAVPAGMEERLMGLTRSRAAKTGGSAGPKYVAVPLAAAILICLFFMADRRGETGAGGSASGPGAGSGTSAAEAAEPAGGGRVEVAAADAGESVRGIVVTASGQPVPGARVMLAGHDVTRLPGTCVSRPDVMLPGTGTTTGTDGRFRIPAGRGRFDVSVEARGRVAVVLPDCSAGSDLRIVLPDGRRLLVKVVDEAGKPIAGARLTVIPNCYLHTTLNLEAMTVPSTWHQGDMMFLVEGRTDEAGTAVFEGLPRREYAMVHARHPEFAEVSATSPLEEAVEATLTLTMVPGQALSGRVVADATGEPVAGARVTRREVEDDDDLETVLGDATETGPDGAFRFGSAGSGKQLLWCKAEGYAPTRLVTKDRSVELKLEKGLTVVGRVVDSAGTPVAEAVVGAGVLSGGSFFGFTPARTGADGRFSIADLPGRRELRLEVSTPGQARLLREFPAPETDTFDAGDLVVSPGGFLTGRVTYQDGRPVERLEMRLAANVDEVWRLSAGESGDDRRAVTEEALTDANGEYRFADLAPGPYTLEFRAEGWPGDERSVVIPVDVAPQRVDIVMNVGWDLVIEAVEDTGEPFAGLDLEAYCDGYQSGTTDAAGRLQLRVKGDEVHVWVREREQFPGFQAVVATPGGNPCRIVLPSRHRISGRVLTHDGQGVSAEVAVWSPDQGYESFTDPTTRTREDGSFEIEVRAAGPVNLRATVVFPQPEGGARRAYTTIVRREGVLPDSEGVELRLSAMTFDGTITVRVEGPDGAPVEGADIRVDDYGIGDSGVVAEGKTGVRGDVLISGLPKTKLSFTAQLTEGFDGETGRAELEVVPDGQSITLRLPRQSPVRGCIVDQDGKPCSKMRVFAYDGERWLNSDEAGEDGQFELWIPRDVAAVTLKAEAEDGDDAGDLPDADPRAFQTIRVTRAGSR